MDQLDFDWTYSSQITTIRKSVFEPVPVPNGCRVSNVSPAAIKSLLLTIHTHAGQDGWCFASLDTLIVETGMSKTQVRRVIRALRSLHLLVEENKRVGRSTVKHRRIAFPNLLDFCPSVDHPNRPSETKELERVSRGNVADSRGNVENSRGNGCTSTGQRLPTKGTKEKDKKALKTKSEFSERSKGRKETPTHLCLKSNISITDLTEPEKVDELFLLAVGRGLVPESESHRLAFFGLCHRMWTWHKKTRRNKPNANAVGLLHKLLESGVNDWIQWVNDDDDRAWGKRAIRNLEQFV